MNATDFPPMPRVQAVLEHPLYRDALGAIESAEADRRFCRHGLDHLLDVGRIAWIINLERGLGLDREVVYAAALLHDVGRSAQYACGVPHDEAGEQLAAEILGTVDAEQRFLPDERRAIVGAVRGHREHPKCACVASSHDVVEDDEAALARVIAEADGLSRACWACDAHDDCYWSDERKNLAIRV